MKNIITNIITTFSVALILSGCASVPEEFVNRPWSRTLKSDNIISIKSTIKVEVTGITSPLLGSEELIGSQIKNHVENLLLRRGFTTNGDIPDYTLSLIYKTQRENKLNSSSMISTSSSSASKYGTFTQSSLGVNIAQVLASAVTRSSTVSTQNMVTIVSYTHAISLEIRDKSKQVVWKGESTWDSDELDILKRIKPALQIILSDLPTDHTYHPSIQEIKDTHFYNYYRLNARNVWFTCPSLPYWIIFDEFPATTSNVPQYIENQNALACYVDLIQTAEFAVPQGDESNWTKPLNPSLWQSVTMGGEYLLGPNNKPVNIIIKLVGQSEAYHVESCYIANDSEYARFQDRLTKWQAALADYYDFYVH
ncbi:MAG: hypothetical protein ACHQQQ_07235 [Bacteroidota bacterium]